MTGRAHPPDGRRDNTGFPRASNGFVCLTEREPSVYVLGPMYETSDIRKGLKVLMDGQPYTVVEFQFVKPGKGSAFTRTKFKNLLTGGVVEKNIRSGEKLEPANVEEKDMQYLYAEGDDFVFMDKSSYEQTTVAGEVVGDDKDLLLDNADCTVLFFNERAVGISLPTFIVVNITQCDPGVKGDTATNVTKPATIETGAVVHVPLFINEGDRIKVDTRTRTYVERAKE